MATFGYANDGAGMPKFALFGNLVNSISSTLASATTITPITYVTEVTIRNRYKEIADNLGIDL